MISSLELHDSFFRLELEDNLPLLIADESQLRILFGNLILNAAQARHSNHGHKLVVRTQQGHQAKTVVVSVVNREGSGGLGGFEFEPGFSTKKDGLGLGLSICKSIVSAHAGELSLLPNDSGGVTAVCRIPCAGSVTDGR